MVVCMGAPAVTTDTGRGAGFTLEIRAVEAEGALLGSSVVHHGARGTEDLRTVDAGVQIVVGGARLAVGARCGARGVSGVEVGRGDGLVAPHAVLQGKGMGMGGCRGGEAGKGGGG